MKKLYVGNLPYNATEADLETLFGQYGAIESAVVITDRASGRSKGFGFITFDNANDANNALELNGNDMGGRKLNVSQAKEKAGDRR